MSDLDPAQAFFVEEVHPTASEFVEDFGSVRKARLAAIMLVHTADHVWHFRPQDRRGSKSEDEFRALLARGCEAYELLMDTTNASKHGILKERPQRVRRIRRSSDVKVGELFGLAPWGEFRWGGEPQAAIECVDGSWRALDVQVIKVHRMWCDLVGVNLPSLPGSESIEHWSNRSG
jgi:hypothetical protein